MCGICGIWTGAEPAEEAVRRMVGALGHRGPDGSGLWSDPAAGLTLGHARLAILDRSPLGHQPMLSASGRLVLSYNGEIYNFRALRAELEAMGDVFRGHSDSEVLLAAIERWGLAAALGRAEGMFALALWDRAARTLSLARDRAGKKPLYYGRTVAGFLLASELKALAAVPGFAGEVDRDALGQFLQYGAVPAPRSIYRGIRQLEPGTILTLAAATAEPAPPEPFWSVREACAAGIREPFAGSFADATDRLERLLGDAVERRLVADVPVGALLSGGIDSSTVVALMRARGAGPVRTFTIGFAEDSHDEAPHARAVAAHLGTEHHELQVSARDALDLVPDLADIYDEPFADSSMLPTILVCRLARQEVTVALTGDGGDELFAGYAYYAQARRHWRKLARRGLAWRQLQAGCLEWAGSGLWSLAGARAPGFAANFARTARALRATDLVDLHLRRRRQELGDPAGLVIGAAPVAAAPPLADAEDQALRAVRLCDFETWLPDDLLVKVDRASMAVGLEARCPMLDRAVVEFAWSLPDEMLVGEGGGKRVLRAVLARHVPPALFERPKGGFDVPLRAWLLGPLRDWAEALLAPEALARAGYLRPAAVTRRWQQLVTGWDRRPHLIWSILMFQLWHQRWLEQRPAGVEREAA